MPPKTPDKTPITATVGQLRKFYTELQTIATKPQFAHKINLKTGEVSLTTALKLYDFLARHGQVIAWAKTTGPATAKEKLEMVDLQVKLLKKVVPKAYELDCLSANEPVNAVTDTKDQDNNKLLLWHGAVEQLESQIFLDLVQDPQAYHHERFGKWLGDHNAYTVDGVQFRLTFPSGKDLASVKNRTNHVGGEATYNDWTNKLSNNDWQWGIHSWNFWARPLPANLIDSHNKRYHEVLSDALLMAINAVKRGQCAASNQALRGIVFKKKGILLKSDHSLVLCTILSYLGKKVSWIDCAADISRLCKAMWHWNHQSYEGYDVDQRLKMSETCKKWLRGWEANIKPLPRIPSDVTSGLKNGHTDHFAKYDYSKNPMLLHVAARHLEDALDDKGINVNHMEIAEMKAAQKAIQKEDIHHVQNHGCDWNNCFNGKNYPWRAQVGTRSPYDPEKWYCLSHAQEALFAFKCLNMPKATFDVLASGTSHTSSYHSQLWQVVCISQRCEHCRNDSPGLQLRAHKTRYAGGRYMTLCYDCSALNVRQQQENIAIVTRLAEATTGGKIEDLPLKDRILPTLKGRGRRHECADKYKNAVCTGRLDPPTSPYAFENRNRSGALICTPCLNIHRNVLWSVNAVMRSCRSYGTMIDLGFQVLEVIKRTTPANRREVLYSRTFRLMPGKVIPVRTQLSLMQTACLAYPNGRNDNERALVRETTITNGPSRPTHGDEMGTEQHPICIDSSDEEQTHNARTPIATRSNKRRANDEVNLDMIRRQRVKLFQK